MSLVHAAAKAVGLMTSVSSTHGHFTDVTMSMDNGPMKSPVLSPTARRTNSFKFNSTYSPTKSAHNNTNTNTNNNVEDRSSNSNNNNDMMSELSPMLPPAVQRQLNAVRK